MWNRGMLKEEAKKVFRYKDNYWTFVLVALIVALLSGGVGGFVYSIPSAAINVLGHSHAAQSYKNRYDDKSDSKMSRVSTPQDFGVDIKINGRDIEDYLRDEMPEDIEEAFDEFDYDEYYDDIPYNGFGMGEIGVFSSSSPFSILAVVVAVFVSLLVYAIGLAIKAFLINPVLLGAKSFFLKSYDNPSDLKDLTCGFKYSYMKNVATLLLRDVFTMLWSLLFVVPGIIKAYEYRMIPYIIAEDPDISYHDAFKKSKEMMMGNKWDTFVLDLSFIAWVLLNAITCGIVGIFYLNPYYCATDANLYRTLKLRPVTGYEEDTNRAQETSDDEENTKAQDTSDDEENTSSDL